MPQKATKFLHRKCRRAACSKWSLFRLGDRRTAECTFCGAPYGRLEVGLDVQDSSRSEPDAWGPREKRPEPAMKLEDTKPGDFEYVSPAKEE